MPRNGHHDDAAMQAHMHRMAGRRRRTLWTHFAVIGLGAWLLASPLQFGLFDPQAALAVRDVTGERGLPGPALRNALTGWSDLASGLALMVFGSLALSPRFRWAQWGTTGVGLWLLFAPLLFWTPSAAAYANDTLVGALAIAFSVLVPMMPGMGHAGMMDDNTLPPGWSYNPSGWLQRLPIIALGLLGVLLARYLAAYQLGHVGAVWEPFFHPGGGNGTERVITSDVSKAWPVADAGLGATAYVLEVLMGVMGSPKRWRTMPWMVSFFFVLVVPLGAVSILFIIIQPIMIGTYCTLCLLQALAMLVMIPLTLDEVVAMGQFMRRSVRDGRPFWRTFLKGDSAPADRPDHQPGFGATLSTQAEAAVRGVTVPWTLAATCAVGGWLMASRAVLPVQPPLADSDHLVGALLITVAVIAMAEVARPLRFLNAAMGMWLVLAPWVLAGGAGMAAAWNDMVAGAVVIGLSLPRGRRSRQHYGGWDVWIF